MNKPRRLTKSKTDKWFLGVIGGIGQYFGLSADAITLLRILVIVVGFGSMFTLFLVYLIVAWILPDADRKEDPRQQHWQSHEQPWEPRGNGGGRKIKEAEKIDDDENWSDF